MTTRMCTALVLALVAVGCGGGGDSSGGTVGGSTGLAADFTASVAAPGAKTVSLQKGTVNGDVITLQVTLTDTTNVYGIAFDLLYDGAKAQYLSWSAGSFLETGGNTPTYQVASPTDGRVVVGASRSGNAGGVNASGTKTVINLNFRVQQAGDNALSFTQGAVYDPSNPPQAISGITWSGGTLTAR